MTDTRTTSQEFAALATEAQNGQLLVEKGVAESCAAQCDDYALQLRNLATRTGSLVRVDSFGTLRSAQLLGGKFNDLAVGEVGTGSFLEALRKHIEAVEAMADMFRKAGAAYTATEHGNTSDIGRST